MNILRLVVLWGLLASPAVAQEAVRFDIRTASGWSFTISGPVTAESCTGDPCRCVDCACPSCPRAAKKDAPKNWHACQVKVVDGDGSIHSGSGTPVWSEGGKTLILTNAHVVPKRLAQRPITVGTYLGWKPGRYVDGSEVSSVGEGRIRIDGPDLCLVEIDAELGAVTMAAEPAAVGSACGHFGYGGRTFESGPAYRGGQVVANDLGKDYIRFSGTSISGDSGAGIFDGQGQLVGVVWGEHYGVTLQDVELFCAESVSVGRGYPRFLERMRERRAARLESRRERQREASSGLPTKIVPNAPAAYRVPSGGCANGQCPIR